MKPLNLLWTGMICLLCGCSAKFMVKSDPLQADVYFKNPKTGEKKPLGKTPLEMPIPDVRAAAGDSVGSGEFFPILVEKDGFIPQSFSIPATSFGTMVTQLDVHLVKGSQEEDVANAKEIVDHLFLAQKFALTGQFERAQIEIDKLISQYPKFARAYSMRASIYYAQKNFPESLKWYEEAIKLDPQLDDAIKMAAKVRTLAGGRLPAAAAAAPTSVPGQPPQGKTQ